MSTEDIIETFEKHEKFLSKKFKSFSKTPDFRIDIPKNEFDYLLILDGLVSQDQQTKMYKKLRAEYCKSNTDVDITTIVSASIWAFFSFKLQQLILIVLIASSMKIFCGKS